MLDDNLFDDSRELVAIVVLLFNCPKRPFLPHNNGDAAEQNVNLDSLSLIKTRRELVLMQTARRVNVLFVKNMWLLQ